MKSLALIVLVVLNLGWVLAETDGSECTSAIENLFKKTDKPDRDWMRLDYLIVASTKNVVHATYWPKKKHGSTSDHHRNPNNGHLESDNTLFGRKYKKEVNNLRLLWAKRKEYAGKHTFEASNKDGILYTMCFTMNDDGAATDCRSKSNVPEKKADPAGFFKRFRCPEQDPQ